MGAPHRSARAEPPGLAGYAASPRKTRLGRTAAVKVPAVRPLAVAVSLRGASRTALAALALLALLRARADDMSTSPEQAYDLGEVPNARAVGMGGALNALGVSTASLFLNPANMALAKVYHLEALAAYSPEAKRQTYGAAIVDSVLNSSHIAGGLGGTWSEFDPSGVHRMWTDVRGAVALP